MSKKKLPVPTGKLPLPDLQPIQEVMKDVFDYLKVAEQESTKRTEIVARKEVALEAIRSRRDIIMKAMEKTFDERALFIGKQFDLLDRAIASGDTQLASQCMLVMADVVKTSPFKAMQEVQGALEQGSIDL